MMIIPAKFQPSSFTGMAGKWGDGRAGGHMMSRDPQTKNEP